MEQGFYKDSIVLLEGVIEEIVARLNVIRQYRKVHNDRDPIEYIFSRVKSEESMKEKLKRKRIWSYSRECINKNIRRCRN